MIPVVHFSFCFSGMHSTGFIIIFFLDTTISRKFSWKSDLKSPDSTVSVSSKTSHTSVEIKFLISNHSFSHFPGRWKCRRNVIGLLNIARNKIYLIAIKLPFFSPNDLVFISLSMHGLKEASFSEDKSIPKCQKL